MATSLATAIQRINALGIKHSLTARSLPALRKAASGNELVAALTRAEHESFAEQELGKKAVIEILSRACLI